MIPYYEGLIFGARRGYEHDEGYNQNPYWDNPTKAASWESGWDDGCRRNSEIGSNFFATVEWEAATFGAAERYSCACGWRGEGQEMITDGTCPDCGGLPAPDPLPQAIEKGIMTMAVQDEILSAAGLPPAEVEAAAAVTASWTALSGKLPGFTLALPDLPIGKPLRHPGGWTGNGDASAFAAKVQRLCGDEERLELLAPRGPKAAPIYKLRIASAGKGLAPAEAPAPDYRRIWPDPGA
jgi:hypothetical protein